MSQNCNFRLRRLVIINEPSTLVCAIRHRFVSASDCSEEFYSNRLIENTDEKPESSVGIIIELPEYICMRCDNRIHV